MRVFNLEKQRLVAGLLESIQLWNFKCFVESPEIEFAPITLLVGPNSSGKTTFIQPLLILKQTLELKAPMSTPLILNGTYIGLGTYNEMVNNHDRQKNIQIGIKVKIPKEVWQSPQYFRPHLKKFKDDLDVRCRISLKYFEKEQKISLSMVEFESKIFLFKIDPLTEQVKANFFGHDIQLEHYSRLHQEQNLRSLLNLLNLLVRTSSPSRKGIMERIEQAALVRLAVDAFISTIENLEYIGPLREYPNRYYDSSGEMVSNVGIMGENAVEVLHQDKVIHGELIKKLNYWLKQLGIAKSISLRTIDAFLYALEITSPNSKTKVNITSTGFGVSQIIPAIVQGHLMSPNSTLILEQPEIHLHPKAQAAIADLLISLSKKGKRFLIETHSEHLILRLQRRVAEGAIDSKDIRIYYFETTPDGSVIRKIDIDDKGELVNFPDGFMEEGMQEALKMALASK